MAPVTATARQRLASLILGRSVLDFIAERRANDMPYRRIAAELRDATDGEIDLSDVAIRSWWLAHKENAENAA